MDSLLAVLFMVLPKAMKAMKSRPGKGDLFGLISHAAQQLAPRKVKFICSFALSSFNMLHFNKIVFGLLVFSILFSACAQDPTVNLDVYVYDAQGNPVDGASVSAYSNYDLGSGANGKWARLNGLLEASARTDQSGRVQLQIIPGNYVITASKGDDAAGTEKLIVSGQNSLSLRLEKIVEPPKPICQNGVLEQGEECESNVACSRGFECASDCTCGEIGPICGNDVCEAGEEQTCQRDCGQTLSVTAGGQYYAIVNSEITVSAIVAGGLGPYSYVWRTEGDFADCVIRDANTQNAKITCTAESDFNAVVRVRDSFAAEAQSRARVVFSQGVEICDNAIDDDFDSTADCEDVECAEAQNCGARLCDGYREINWPASATGLALLGAQNQELASLNRQASALTSELLALKPIPLKYGGANPNTIYKKAALRFAVLQRLVEKDPKAFLAHVIPNEEQKGFALNTLRILEKQIEPTGVVEVLEVPHLTEEDRRTKSWQDFNYFLKKGDMALSIRFADKSSPPIVSGARVKVKGVQFANYLVAESAQEDLSVLSEPQIGNLGEQKLAVIVTMAPGDTVVIPESLNMALQDANSSISEFSYNKAWISWRIYGPYELERLAPYMGLMSVADSDVNFLDIDRVVWIDSRHSCGACALVWKSIYLTPDGDVNLSFSFYNHFPWPDTIVHELGHNFGVFHANFMDCGNRAIDVPGNCESVQYGDFFDTMGNAYYGGHFNSPHKETMGWLSDRIRTITQNGVYDLSNFEDGKTSNYPLALRVPRKFNDDGTASEYFYVEYRTARGKDTEVMSSTIPYSIQSPNGPQVRVTGYEYGGGGGDTHNLDMTPPDYPARAGLAPGASFTASGGLVIRTVSANHSSAQIEVTLSAEKCVRETPTLSISPSVIRGRWVENFFYNIQIANNDAETCSDREVYFTLNQSQGGIRTWNGFYQVYSDDTQDGIIPYKLKAKGKISGTVLPYYNPEGENDFIFSIKEMGGAVLASAQVKAIVARQSPTPLWLNKDVAKKFVYLKPGKLILDKDGNIHRVDAGFTTDNGLPTDGSAKAIDMLKFSRWNSTVFVLDSKGNIREAGEKVLDNKLSEAMDNSPKLACDMVVDMDLGTKESYIALLDAKGGVFDLFGVHNNFPTTCTSSSGATDAYRPSEAHAVEVTPWHDNTGSRTQGYFILSRNGTIYACGGAPVTYTRYNEAFPSNRRAVAFEYVPNKGLLVLDSFGKIYATGTAQKNGEPNLGRDYARDLELIESENGELAGYGVLTGDGQISEFFFSQAAGQ